MRLAPMLWAATAAAILPVTASAVGFSVGANVGSARVNGGDFPGSDTGWKAHIGSNLNDIFGGEIGYVDFGHLGGNGPSAYAWAPALTVGVPFGMANAYVKGGVSFADVKGSSIRQEYHANKPFFGVGFRIGMTRNEDGAGLGFRVEYERYDVNNAHVDMAQAGLEFLFGR